MGNGYHLRGRSLLAFVLVALIWGSTWFAIKNQIGTVPAGWSVVWRFALSSVGMVLLARVRGDSLRLPPGGQKLAMLIGLSQFCLNYEFVYQSERYLTSGIVAVVYALLLVPNALFSALFLGTKLRGRFVLGSGVAIAGIAMLLLHEVRLAPPGAQVPLGIALACAGLIAASVSNVLMAGKVARGSGPVPLMAWSMIWGTAIDIVFALVHDGPPAFDTQPHYWLGIAYLAIIGSVVTFPLYAALIRDIGAGRAAYNGVAVPVVAMLLSSLLEHYRWSVLAAAGAACAMIGLLIALPGRAQSVVSEASPST